MVTMDLDVINRSFVLLVHQYESIPTIIYARIHILSLK